jgi:hypothetical protein
VIAINLFEGLLIEPGDHIGVSGSRHAPTREALNSLRFLVDQLQAMGAAVLHQGCCTGWDEASISIGRKAGLKIVGHPPVKDAFRSQWAMENSDELRSPKSYSARDSDIAFESVVLLTGPKYPEYDYRSAHSGTWLTTRYARRYNCGVYACFTDGSIEDVTERTEPDDSTRPK